MDPIDATTGTHKHLVFLRKVDVGRGAAVEDLGKLPEHFLDGGKDKVPNLLGVSNALGAVVAVAEGEIRLCRATEHFAACSEDGGMGTDCMAAPDIVRPITGVFVCSRAARRGAIRADNGRADGRRGALLRYVRRHEQQGCGKGGADGTMGSPKEAQGLRCEMANALPKEGKSADAAVLCSDGKLHLIDSATGTTTSTSAGPWTAFSWAPATCVEPVWRCSAAMQGQKSPSWTPPRQASALGCPPDNEEEEWMFSDGGDAVHEIFWAEERTAFVAHREVDESGGPVHACGEPWMGKLHTLEGDILKGGQGGEKTWTFITNANDDYPCAT